MFRRLLPIALAICGSVLPASAQDCRLQEVASLTIEHGPNGLLLVPVALSNTRTLMLLDTGATRGVIDAALALKMGLTPMKVIQPQPIYALGGVPYFGFVQLNTPNMYLASGAQLDHFAVVPSLDIGASHSADIKFMLAGIDEPSAPGLKGILGSNILRNFDVEIDPAAGKVNLFSPDHCAGKVVYWTHDYTDIPVHLSADGAIEFEAQLDGKDVDALLDTGASDTTLNQRAARRLFDVGPGTDGVELVSGEGAKALYRMRFKSLAAGGIAVSNPQIHLAPDTLGRKIAEQAFDDRHSLGDIPNTPSMILGMDVLSHLHIYIAYREKTLYVTGADAR